MIKRPLTFAVLLLVLIIAGLKVSGMPLWRDISEANEITGYLEKHEQVTVRGIVDRREEKEKTTLYYLKNTYLNRI